MNRITVSLELLVQWCPQVEKKLNLLYVKQAPNLDTTIFREMRNNNQSFI